VSDLNDLFAEWQAAIIPLREAILATTIRFSDLADAFRPWVDEIQQEQAIESGLAAKVITKRTAQKLRRMIGV